MHDVSIIELGASCAVSAIENTLADRHKLISIQPTVAIVFMLHERYGMGDTNTKASLRSCAATDDSVLVVPVAYPLPGGDGVLASAAYAGGGHLPQD